MPNRYEFVLYLPDGLKINKWSAILCVIAAISLVFSGLIAPTILRSSMSENNLKLIVSQRLDENIQLLKQVNEEIKFRNEQARGERPNFQKWKEKPLWENELGDKTVSNGDKIHSGLPPKDLHNSATRGSNNYKFQNSVNVERIDLKTFESKQFHWPAFEQRNERWCAAFNSEENLKSGQIQPFPWMDFPSKVRGEYNQFTIEPREKLFVRCRTRLFRITPVNPTWKEGEGADCQITIASFGSLDRLPALAETTRM